MVAYTDYLRDARVRREAETLAAAGFDVVCLTTRNGAGPAEFVHEGVQVRELGVRKYQGKDMLAYTASYVRFLLSASAACLRLLLKGRLDVVHAHNLPDFLVFAGLLPRLAGRKVVLDVHDSVPETFATKFEGRPLLMRALRLEESFSASVAHKVICVNDPQRETLVGRGIPAAKTFISMNVPDPRIFAAAPASTVQRTAASDTFNLVYHGTMAARLGVDLVIRAVALVRERIPTVRLHLWGKGDDLTQFKELARELRLEEHVLFSPGFPLEELPSRLAAMDVGVVGNRRSVAADLMLPVKLMEYVSLRIPAIVPRLRTIEHYFSQDMVAYFEPEDASSLAATIHRLYVAPELRRRQADVASRFLAEYGWERQGPSFVSFYQRLLEN